ncbi:hypothetical protein QEV13_06920 [Trueperella pyogenes]|uniref:hypothetical protein n=1 Tax=Trueperella pyogenes TaxID=1661 RepID=UPI0024BFEFCE|nr:hypothetical protein [Trueperella pyogenes]WHU60383.1 hypothetical protein QEV13_06920 [Trueperella pyogenes]
MMKTSKIVIAGLTSVALMFGSVGVANAQPYESPSSVATVSENPEELARTARAMELLLGYYDSIPNDILAQGEEAVKAWQEDHPIPMVRASFWGCLGSVAWAIGSNVVSVAKIAKIKKYMQALGGVKEAVRLMWGASFKLEKMKAAGGALAGLGAEILGIKGVKDQCLS